MTNLVVNKCNFAKVKKEREHAQYFHADGDLPNQIVDDFLCALQKAGATNYSVNWKFV